MTDIACSLLAGIFRRVIGGYPAGKLKVFRTIIKFLYGALLAYLVIGIHWLLIPCGIAIWLGEKPGLGHWRGAIVRNRAGFTEIFLGKPEWYQTGWLKSHNISASYLSSVVRGLIFGSLIIPLSYFDPRLLIIPLAMMIALPLSGLIAGYMPKTKILELGDPKKHWSWDEMIEGVIAGTICSLFTTPLW